MQKIFFEPRMYKIFLEWMCLSCLLYTSDAADERSSVDLGGRRIIKKKKKEESGAERRYKQNTKEIIEQRIRDNAGGSRDELWK